MNISSCMYFHVFNKTDKKQAVWFSSWTRLQLLDSSSAPGLVFLIFARQDVFLRICKSNQSSPDCLSATVVIRLNSVLLSKKILFVSTLSSCVLSVCSSIARLALNPKLKDLAFSCGFRDTCLLITYMLAPPRWLSSY